MATRQVLADLLADWRHLGGAASFEAMGGVDAFERVRAGAPVDVVVLASDAIDRLASAGCLVADSRTALVRSAVAVAVRAGAPLPTIDTPQALRDAVAAAGTIGCSTGPSGVALKALLERWDLGAGGPRLVQAPPGVAVGTLVARGEVALGFQQLSELKDVPGITVLGTMPPGLEIVTTFSGAVGAACDRPDAARALLNFLRSPLADAAKWRHGMQPA